MIEKLEFKTFIDRRKAIDSGSIESRVPSNLEIINKINELIDQQNRIEEAVKYMATVFPGYYASKVRKAVDDILNKA